MRCQRRGVAINVALAVAFATLDTVLTLAGASWWPRDPGPLAWTLLAVQAACCLALVARRRAPLTVVAVLAAFTLLVTLLASPVHALDPANTGTCWAPFASVLASYAPIQYHRNRRVALLAVLVLSLVAARPWDPSITVITIGMARTLIGPLLAAYLIARRQLVGALTERAERAEREQVLLAERAVTDERARLAAEMHDIVTRHITLMVMQAGALKVTGADEATRRTAEELRAAGCRALDELRDLIGILRTNEQGGEHTPRAADLEELAAEANAAGAPTTLTLHGDPSLASPLVARTVRAVVAEALTNVRKHAPGAATHVHVRFERDRVHLDVRNEEPPRQADAAVVASGSGMGLAGLRQRLGLVHGSLRTAQLPDGGFELDAQLPAYVPTSEPLTSLVEAGR